MIANKDHIGANTETSRALPRKDTEDGDEPQDPSPEVPQISRHRPAGDSKLGKRKLPTTKTVPTPAESSEPKLPVPTDMHELTVSAQDKTVPKANTSSKTEDKPSLLGRAKRKSKKFMKSKLISVLRKCKNYLQGCRKNYLVEIESSWYGGSVPLVS